MKETYEKLYTYGKSLTQDLQAVQEHLYQALCQADTENSNLQNKMAEMRAASEGEIQRLANLLQQKNIANQAMRQKLDSQIAELQHSVKQAAEYQSFLEQQQGKIAAKERELNARTKELGDRERKIAEGEEALKTKEEELEKKRRELEAGDASKKVQALEKEKKDMENRLEEANQNYNQALQEKASLARKLFALSSDYDKKLQEKDEKIQELENALATYRPKPQVIRCISYSSNDDTDR
ncbi:hypothetical protein [Anaerovibrio lipolyticus]|uniref:hypothetical protein n=1 Tax=Anaerovibrio lipolyticus TaxID=82374 RepID=UPI001F226731|nr:hypothetical protein [Anaerovibrio lipolyticus]